MTERLLHIRDVKEMTGLGKSTIYRKMADEKAPFPRPVAIGTIVRWKESEISAWIATLPSVELRRRA